MGNWIYQRLAPGEFQKLTYATWEKFREGKAPLTPSDDGCVWTAGFWMAMENRRVIGVLEVSLSRRRVTPEGIHTQEMREEGSHAAIRMVWEKWDARRAQASAKQENTEAPSVVVKAEARMAYGRFRWKPTAGDKAALCALVNQRAGWRVLAEDDFDQAK